MSLPRMPVSGFLQLMRVTPLGWLIGVWGLHILFGKLLVTSPIWYVPICLGTAVYGALSKTKWSFTLSTIWWLVFLESVAEFLIASLILLKIGPLEWPRPAGTFFFFQPLIVGFGILALVKFVALGFAPLCQGFSTKLLKMDFKHRRAFTWAMTFFAAMMTAAVACWHWRIIEAASKSSWSLQAIHQLSFTAGVITVVAALYIAALMVLVAVVVLPISRAGAKLKQSGTRLQAFIILAWTAGLGLGLGWLAGSKP